MSLKIVIKIFFDLQCGASKSLQDQRSYPPSPGQHPLGVCWSQWLAGLPLCWDGHLAAMCTWSVHHLAQICTLFPLEEKKKKNRNKSSISLSIITCLFQVGITDCQLTNIINTTKPASASHSRGTVSQSVLLCWVMTLQSSKQHITLEQLSAPSKSLSTLMSIHEWRKNSAKTRESGTRATYFIMLGNYSVLPPLPLSPLHRKKHKWMLANLHPCPRSPGNQRAKRTPPHVLCFISTLKAHGGNIDWGDQLCPPCILYASYFLSFWIMSMSLAAL